MIRVAAACRDEHMSHPGKWVPLVKMVNIFFCLTFSAIMFVSSGSQELTEFMERCVVSSSGIIYYGNTPPKTNISPENDGWKLEDYNFLFNF